MRLSITALVIISLLFAACAKDDTKSSILVSVKDGTDYLGQAVVYLKKDTSSLMPTLNDYSQYKIGDAKGEVSFEGLEAGRYHFYAIGYSNKLQKEIKGYTTIHILYNMSHKISIQAN